MIIVLCCPNFVMETDPKNSVFLMPIKPIIEPQDDEKKIRLKYRLMLIKKLAAILVYICFVILLALLLGIYYVYFWPLSNLGKSSDKSSEIDYDVTTEFDFATTTMAIETTLGTTQGPTTCKSFYF